MSIDAPKSTIAPESPVSPSAVEYLEKKFHELDDDYKGAHCALIAKQVADLIKTEGGKPKFLSIFGRRLDSINTGTMKPKRYQGRVAWGGHTVCESGGYIYDPLVGKPLPREEYLATVFMEPVTADANTMFDLK